MAPADQLQISDPTSPPAAMLQLPTDWLNLLEDADDAAAARRRYERLVQQVFPGMEPQMQSHAVNAMVEWREMVWGSGILAFGIVAVPADGERTEALWQVLVRLVHLPSISPELNPGTALSHLMKGTYEHAFHVEAFETEMGPGAGFVAKLPMTFTTDSAEEPGKEMMLGASAAIACPPGGGWSILVAGVSRDPEQAEELGFLVGQIAGHSKTVPVETEDPGIPRQSSPQDAGP